MKNRHVITEKKYAEASLPLTTEAGKTLETFGDKKQKGAEPEELKPPLKAQSAKISVPTFDGLQMISVEDIVKCIAHESYTEIILTCGSKFIVSRKLKEYEEMLAAFNFFRIHNSYLVNLRHVKKYIKGNG